MLIYLQTKPHLYKKAAVMVWTVSGSCFVKHIYMQLFCSKEGNTAAGFSIEQDTKMLRNKEHVHTIFISYYLRAEKLH